MQSTGGLVSTTADKLVKIALLPITIPAKITAIVAGKALHVTSNVMVHIIRLNESSCRTRIGQEASQSTRSESNSLQPHEVLIHTAIGFVPVAKKAVKNVMDHVGSTMLNLVAWQNPGESSSEHSPDEPIIHHCRTFDNVDLCPIVSDGIEASETKEDPSCLQQVASEEPVATRQVSTHQLSIIALQKQIRESFYFSLRVCDLQILSKANGCNNMLKQLELRHCGHNEHLGEAITKMVEQALLLAENGRFELTNNIQNQANRSSPKRKLDGNRYSKYPTKTEISPIIWKEEGATSKHLKKLISKRCNVKRIHILQTEIFLWSGRIQSKDINSYSHKIPLFKARGIILNMTPKDLVDLFMDSSKVYLYNKFSNGRKDVCIFENNQDGIVTKVVENEAQIPFSGKIIKVLTLLHSRPLNIDGKHDGFIVVSRSVEMSSEPLNTMPPVNNGKHEASPGDKNEVIWGVSILRKVPGNEQMVDLTTMTQANSCAVPSFMAHKLGVMCANDFIKNVRNIQL